MHTINHFDSANELSIELINSIKASFKSKAISIAVSDEKYERITLDEYNKELIVSEKEYDAGEYVSLNEFKNEVKNW